MVEWENNELGCEINLSYITTVPNKLSSDIDIKSLFPRGVIRFLLDGGSTNHVTYIVQVVMVFTGTQRTLRGIVGGTSVDIVHFKRCFMGESKIATCIMGAIYSTHVTQNLLSEGRLLQGGWRFAADKSYMYHKSRPQEKVTIVHEHGLQWNNIYFPSLQCPVGHKPTQESEFSTLAALEDISNVTLAEHEAQAHVPLLPPGACKSCDANKRHRKPVRRRRMDEEHKKRLHGVVSTDLCGPLVRSVGGNAYLQLWKQLWTRDVVPTFLKTKHARNTHANYLLYCQIRPKPDIVLSEQGKEFPGEFKAGVGNARSSPTHLPHLNGSLEVEDGLSIKGAATVIWCARMLLGPNTAEAQGPIRRWPDAVKYVCYTFGRLRRKCNPGGGVSSHELRAGAPPNNSFMKPWYAHGHYLVVNPTKKPSKLQGGRRRPCRLLS